MKHLIETKHFKNKTKHYTEEIELNYLVVYTIKQL